MAKKKTSKKYFDPRDFFPHMDALSDGADVEFPADMNEYFTQQAKASNPAYWMHMGKVMAQSETTAPWLWYGMMLGTLEAMRASTKPSGKIDRRHAEAVEAIHKFTKHVAGADAVKPPKQKKKKPSKVVPQKAAPKVSQNNDEPIDHAPLGLLNIMAEPADRAADDLKWISGVGPKLEETLNELGIFKFGQIAKWSETEIDWVEEYLNFPGRIERDNWIDQAKALAKGGWDEYVKVFGKEPR